MQPPTPRPVHDPQSTNSSAQPLPARPAPTTPAAPSRKLWLVLVRVVARKTRAAGGTVAKAQDLVQDAFRIATERTITGDNPPPSDPDAYATYMYEICLGLASNYRRGVARHPMNRLTAARHLASELPSPHEEAERKERAHILDLVKKALEDDSQGAVPLMMFQKAAEEGIERQADFARALGVPVAVIQKAERRIERVSVMVQNEIAHEAIQRAARRSS
jgi:DNA-directed RNA polymerase specialized sigma24 family protein